MVQSNEKYSTTQSVQNLISPVFEFEKFNIGIKDFKKADTKENRCFRLALDLGESRHFKK